MREIVIDTETTGLDPSKGDRIVEIGAVELLNKIPTGRTFQVYINPGRTMSEEVIRVHGLTNEFLKDKPAFESVAKDFLAFVGRDMLVIHNAPFDMAFLNAELRQAGFPAPLPNPVTDTLEIARERFPGKRNSLDALCQRFSVDASARDKHGALLDSQLLAEVYLELCGGREPGFALGFEEKRAFRDPEAKKEVRAARVFTVPEEERKAHEAFVAKLTDALWNQV